MTQSVYTNYTLLLRNQKKKQETPSTMQVQDSAPAKELPPPRLYKR
jgi:hypothetical protein